ncbi:MAG: hypothetical protein QW590_02345 [Candidatus Bilamarchaeaceae archaeon]
MEEIFAKKEEGQAVVEEKKEKKEKVEKKPKFLHILDQDQVEIKILNEGDVEDAVKVLKQCSFEVTDNEVRKIISYGMSFGCYVNRVLIGVGLGWPTSYDAEKRRFVGESYNAIYLEEPAVLLMYEGRGIRRILVRERENAALARNYRYTVAFISDDVPEGSITDYIKESGTQMEKLYLSENYEFFRTERGVLAVKRVGG